MQNIYRGLSHIRNSFLNKLTGFMNIISGFQKHCKAKVTRKLQCQTVQILRLPILLLLICAIFLLETITSFILIQITRSKFFQINDTRSSLNLTDDDMTGFCSAIANFEKIKNVTMT